MKQNMKTTIKGIWNVGWRALLCLTALAVIGAVVLIFIAYRQDMNKSYTDTVLSENVSSYCYYRRDEICIYNQATRRHTLKGLQWVVKAQDKDSLTVFCRKGKRGFLNVNTGKAVIKEQYRRAWVFSEGMAAVMKNGKIGFINPQNETILPFEYDYSDRNGMPIDYLFLDGYCTMTNAEGACGLIDRTGRWVIEAKYDCIWPPHKGKYRIVKDGGRYGLLDGNLKFIFPIEYDYIEYSDDYGVYLSKDGCKWQADYDGTILNPFVFDNTDYVHYASGSTSHQSTCEDVGFVDELTFTLSDYLTYTVDGLCGILRRDNGKVVIPALYSQINMVSPTLFEALTTDDKRMFIDINGKSIEK